MDDKKKRRTVSAARLYWAIKDACELYKLDIWDGDGVTVNALLEALKDDNMEAAR